MRIFRGLDNLPRFQGAVATMGSFDGLHCGHRVLLDRVLERKAQLGGESVVITFDPHPRYVLGTGEGMQLLSTIEEKALLLEQAGIDNLLIIPFTIAFSQTSPQEFITTLSERIGIQTMVVGYNHRFGHKKEGNYDYLSSRRGNMEILMVEQQQVAKSKVSSTIVRQNIAKGLMERASAMLSRPYIIICQSLGDGSLAGIAPQKMLPPAGAYVVNVNGEKNELWIGQQRTLHLAHAATEGKVLIEIIHSK